MRSQSPRRMWVAALVCVSTLVACSNQNSPMDLSKATTDARVGIQVGGPRLGSQVVAALAEAYNQMDDAKLAGLLSNQPGASYLFFGTTDFWGKVEEDRIAARMFRPQDVLPGENPVPVELWLAGIQAEFKQLTAWQERPDLYRSPANPDGLDPALWQAIEAQYRTIVFFDLQGDTDFRVDGRQNFIVILDLTGMLGPARGAYLYRWEDLGSARAAIASEVTWTAMKSLYK
jgi:hypothetical protein